MRKMFMIMLTIAMCLTPSVVYASTYENDETGYEAIIVDEAGLLDSSEKADLLEEMEGITEYTNVALLTLDRNAESTEHFAMVYCRNELYGDGIVFVIDMDNRMLWLECQGKVSYTITTDYTQTIADNVYTYATDAEYYKCASKAFEQVHRLLEGQWIAQPMKYICNAFLAVAIAFLINYFVARVTSRTGKASARQIMGGIFTKVDINNARADFTHQTKRYSPQSSGSSGGGGRSGGGGGGRSGGGGGGRSGGGHRF